MKSMKYFYITALFCFLFQTACRQEKTPLQMVYGKWQGAKWTNNSKEANAESVKSINFEFKPDSIYIAHMGMQNESGTFNLKNNCFNAMSIYGVPKKCPILRLEKDTMVWMMDSVQQPGNLYLVRVKE
jgi:hypothetical protein